MQEFSINDKEKLVMKLLHYFITEESYTPIILHGAKNEIWLENLEHPYKIVRIVSNYVHNEEQYEYDLLRTQKILKSIKQKILSLKVPTLSIYVDMNENVKPYSMRNIDCIAVDETTDFSKIEVLKETFPDMEQKLEFNEKGIELFAKITSDINEKSAQDAKKTENLFAPKRPVITQALILVNTILFLFSLYYEDLILLIFSNYPRFIFQGEYFRLLTAAFVHVDAFHFLCNIYTLYIVGSQVESFFGKWKYLGIYLFSAICGNLLSVLFLDMNTISFGASGALFGLLGALLYFGYHYRVYLGNVLKSQLIPLIVLNLCIGFLVPGIDNAAHIGGLVGGLFITMAIGIQDRRDETFRKNGILLSILYLAFLIFMMFYRQMQL